MHRSLTFAVSSRLGPAFWGGFGAAGFGGGIVAGALIGSALIGVLAEWLSARQRRSRGNSDNGEGGEAASGARSEEAALLLALVATTNGLGALTFLAVDCAVAVSASAAGGPLIAVARSLIVFIGALLLGSE